MADTGERDVRDRLAAGLFLRAFPELDWAQDASEDSRIIYRLKADNILSALPTVGLRIGMVEE